MESRPGRGKPDAQPAAVSPRPWRKITTESAEPEGAGMTMPSPPPTDPVDDGFDIVRLARWERGGGGRAERAREGRERVRETVREVRPAEEMKGTAKAQRQQAVDASWMRRVLSADGVDQSGMRVM